MQSEGVQRCLWCIKAAYMPSSPFRTRLIKLLWEILVSNESVHSIESPQNFQLILQSLFSLLPTFGEDSKILNDLLRQVRLGCCGELDKNAIEEHYGARFIDEDDIQPVRDAIFVESLAKCFDNHVLSARRWLLENVVQVFNASPSPSSAN